MRRRGATRRRSFSPDPEDDIGAVRTRVPAAYDARAPPPVSPGAPRGGEQRFRLHRRLANCATAIRNAVDMLAAAEAEVERLEGAVGEALGRMRGSARLQGGGARRRMVDGEAQFYHDWAAMGEAVAGSLVRAEEEGEGGDD